MASNGVSMTSQPSLSEHGPLKRAVEADELLEAVKSLVVDFIHKADDDASSKSEGHGLQQPGSGPRTALLEHHPPRKLHQLMDFSIPESGQGKDGLIAAAQQLLKFSVNTWDQGFLDKLYASTTPVGLASDMLLSALNTNVHIYDVSPALTLIEKETTRRLASMFGLKGRWAGGVSQPGGSAANQSSLVIARNNLFPKTKTEGYGGKQFVLFTSAHGHYSVEKAAQICGFGSDAVRSVAVDEQGRMRPDALKTAIEKAEAEGETPFYVNATAGTTVLGSFDPLNEIADICQKHKLWMHVDGSWGASIIFSNAQKYKLNGIERADSIAMCPHKMMNVPLTCSLLLGKDLREFHRAMTLPAGYLYHDGDDADATAVDQSVVDTDTPDAHPNLEQEAKEFWDLGDLTPQCGRRGDTLKLALSWIYYGTDGYGAYIDHAFAMASHLASGVASNPKFSLLSENPPPCLQVCFYFNKQSGAGHRNRNSRITGEVKKALVPKGFMIDYAPGEDGNFFRVVVNGQTRKETVEGLMKAIENAGEAVKL